MTIAFRVHEELTRVHGRRNMDFDIGLGQGVFHLKWKQPETCFSKRWTKVFCSEYVDRVCFFLTYQNVKLTLIFNVVRIFFKYCVEGLNFSFWY